MNSTRNVTSSTHDTPLVSIVTPSFNQAAYLEATIQSVLRQDYANIEYLVVDGGSTDWSLEIIRKYSNRLAWWVSERDSGQAEAINKGILRAQGEIVAWLNSDDLYLPGAISWAVQTLADNPGCSFIYGNAVTIDPDGHLLNRLVFEDWGLTDLMAFRIICQPAVFMRRAFLEQSGLLDTKLHYMLDHHLWLRLARAAPFQHLSAFLAAARHHPGAKNVAQAAGFGRETLELLEWMKSDPQFSGLLQTQRRKIEAGAYRLNARYLLDSGEAGQALKWYAKSFASSPKYALHHWHRMLYALASLAGLKKLGDGYLQKRFRRQAIWPDIPGRQGWPGLA
jgi:glycosyltransferase involved in cell wall biosynthesis